jgi:anti-sigma regulatory factor (Ser/Thr protein kinase)
MKVQEKVQRIEKIDITPDKSIFHKIGEANYSISDAVAELVDNSIDAANQSGIEIVVILDKQNGKIIVSDNGCGMSKEIAVKALVLAHSTKKKKESLGEFGLGLKSACTSLGKYFKIMTTAAGSTETYILTYDKEKFIADGSWTAYPIAIDKISKDEHGTTVEISSLKVKLYDALVTRLKNDLSQRYGPFILHNNVVIRVGLSDKSAKPCKPELIELDKDGREKFKYKLNNGEMITGWWGLRKVSSGVQSGFNLFRRGRLIRASEKLGYNPHPMTNHIVGEINLNPVPVTHNKREFILESGEFLEFIKKFWGDKTGKLVGERIKGKIDGITAKATERWNQEKTNNQLPKPVKDALKDDILRALNRVDDFREMAFPDSAKQKKRSADGIEAEIEKRNKQTRIATEEPIEDSIRENEKRTPLKIKRQTAKFIVINGKKLRFDFEFSNLGDNNLDKETVLTEKGIEIYINTGFKGYSISRDSRYYAIHHVSEAIAEIYLREAKQSMDRLFELRNRLISEVAAILSEEEEVKKLSKQEEELEKIKQKKQELFEKAQQSSL